MKLVNEQITELAPMAERLLCKQEVVGSTPTDSIRLGMGKTTRP